MATEIKVPQLGESISEVQIAEWQFQEGDRVEKDDTLVMIDSDKATVELPAPASGTLAKIIKQNGDEAKVGDVIGTIETGESSSDKKGKARDEEGRTSNPKSSSKNDKDKDMDKDKSEAKPKSGKKRKSQKKDSKEEEGEEGLIESEDAPREDGEEKDDSQSESSDKDKPRIMPAARRLLEEHGVHAEDVEATGPGGRLLKEDVLAYLESQQDEEERTADEEFESEEKAGFGKEGRESETVPMTMLRRTVAKRLVEAQSTMAILTTFNEIDMSAVIALRKEHKESFEEKHGVKLGFMSFFVKAVTLAFKEAPKLNAEVRGDEIVQYHYSDIGVAIGAGKGLVVPPLRNAERMSFAEIEKTIADLARRAKKNKLKPHELEGGTFTISNGGIYGSLLSTPIINPPQSGILGLHAIQDRPVAREGKVEIRPMMYVALSYDHRIVDGREAVTFLRLVKEQIESPMRMLMEL